MPGIATQKQLLINAPVNFGNSTITLLIKVISLHGALLLEQMLQLMVCMFLSVSEISASSRNAV